MHRKVLESKLDDYIEELQECYEDKEIGNSVISNLHINIGEYHAIKGDIKNSKEHFFKALELNLIEIKTNPVTMFFTGD